MSKHTQEPWKVCHWKDDRRGFEIADRNQNRVGFDMTEANARRIVACVNACAGLPTEQLEASPLGGVLNGVAGLIAQRDELLTALHDAATSLETIQLRSFGQDSFLDSKPEMRSYAGSRAAVAREAINKVKGGAS